MLYFFYFTGAAADVLYVCKTGYADFITWTPRQTVIFRVQQDEGFICKAVDTISRFWARHIYPQLAGSSVPETELEVQVQHTLFRDCKYIVYHVIYAI